jgi:hypothetical protein
MWLPEVKLIAFASSTKFLVTLLLSILHSAAFYLRAWDHWIWLFYRTKTNAMRLFLLFYVILFLTLNFFFDDTLVFFLALTTFPVSVYLLVTKAKRKKIRTLPKEQASTTKIIESREESLHKSPKQI